MIKWLDSLNREWGIDAAIAHNENYVNITTYPPKGNYGDTIQLTTQAFKDFRLMLCELKVGE
jgi:hypothetical protein